MKINFKYLPILLIVFLIASCSKTVTKKEVADSVPTDVVETDALFNFIEKSGDFINSKKSPAIIQPQDVYDNLGKYLVIDTRPKEEYVDGHIDGAYNVKFDSLIVFLSNEISVSRFEKIVLVCHSGQSASYAASVLRLIGYGNAFAMKWGMSGWNKEFAGDYWLKNISNSSVNQLDTNITEKPAKVDGAKYPKIETGKTTGYDILKDRAAKILKDGFKKVNIKYDSLMKDPSKYFIVNYWTLDEYKQGHLKGACQYTPKESFSRKGLLSTLPMDKPILVYCFTGHTSAYMAAYLRILGYDAYSLSYGANAFMNGKMAVNEKIKKDFNPTRDIMNFPTVKGELPSPNVPVTASTTTETKNDSAKTPEKKEAAPKKKKSGGGGGC